ncbi:integrase core domain protein [Pelomyxa schiedti]|nr:integrase core domain protein [Pelomyxa schiedti]
MPAGNEYILVMVDHFTGWPMAYATPTADAGTTARVFVDHWICNMGPPDILVSDRGSHFLNELVEEVNILFQIEHRKSSAYHPQTNGKTERFNKTLIGMLRISLCVPMHNPLLAVAPNGNEKWTFFGYQG